MLKQGCDWGFNLFQKNKNKLQLGSYLVENTKIRYEYGWGVILPKKQKKSMPWVFFH